MLLEQSSATKKPRSDGSDRHIQNGGSGIVGLVFHVDNHYRRPVDFRQHGQRAAQHLVELGQLHDASEREINHSVLMSPRRGDLIEFGVLVGRDAALALAFLDPDIVAYREEPRRAVGSQTVLVAATVGSEVGEVSTTDIPPYRPTAVPPSTKTHPLSWLHAVVPSCLMRNSSALPPPA